MHKLYWFWYSASFKLTQLIFYLTFIIALLSCEIKVKYLSMRERMRGKEGDRERVCVFKTITMMMMATIMLIITME